MSVLQKLRKTMEVYLNLVKRAISKSYCLVLNFYLRHQIDLSRSLNSHCLRSFSHEVLVSFKRMMKSISCYTFQTFNGAFDSWGLSSTDCTREKYPHPMG